VRKKEVNYNAGARVTILTSGIIDPVDRSLYKAPSIDFEILRDAQFSTLETNSQGTHKFILVGGDEGIGKTVLLSQFVKLVKKDCIALFIDPINKNSYREESLLIDLYVQINEYQGKSATPDDYTEAKLHSSLHGLKYYLNRKADVLYFVIDGLDELPEEFGTVVKKIFDILPTVCQNIKYVFSICNGPVKALVPDAYSLCMTMMLLSTGEAKELIPDLDQCQVEELLGLFPRKPSVIVQIRRLLKSGITYDDLVNGEHDLTCDLYEFEWESKIEHIERIPETLSILAFSENNLTLQDLIDVTSDSKKSINSFIVDTNILTINHEVVNYISAGMKKHAAKYFEEDHHESSKKIVSYLQKRPKDIDSLSSIASYLSKSGENSEVIHHLDNKHLESILELSLSFSEVVKQVNYGVAASIHNKSEESALRFVQLKSFIADSNVGKILTSEIYTYLEIDDIKSAMDLASSARSIEEKIQLYSKIAKHQSGEGRPLSDFINDEISYLYKKIDPVFIGVDQSVEIAIDLFPVYPDYSLSIINRLDSYGAGENKSDYAFFRFSLALLHSNDGSLEALEEKSMSLSEKKKTFFSALSIFKRGTPAKKILEQLDKIKVIAPGEQLFVLRNWIKAFPDMEDNYILVAKSISLAISTTEFSANAGFYLDMVSALDCMTRDESADIYQKVLIQLPTLRTKGPTIDYVNLELLLDLHERKHLTGTNRVGELYDYIDINIPDLAIALASLSFLDKYVQRHSLTR